jgi:leader peptidase (prepilin peptidase)/N-methyltransferase
MLFFGAYYYVVSIAHLYDSPLQQLVRFGVLAAFIWTMIVVAFIDLDHKLILDKVSYPAIPIFYGLGLLLPEHSWRHGLIGIAVGYGIVRLISDGFYLLTKREGLGYGDGKLLAIVGALFGWQGVMVALFFGSMLGTLILVPLLSFQRARGGGTSVGESEADPGERDQIASVGRVAVPFGPFLAASAVLYLFSESFLRVRFWLFWEYWS